MTNQSQRHEFRFDEDAEKIYKQFLIGLIKMMTILNMR